MNTRDLIAMFGFVLIISLCVVVIWAKRKHCLPVVLGWSVRGAMLSLAFIVFWVSIVDLKFGRFFEAMDNIKSPFSQPSWPDPLFVFAPLLAFIGSIAVVARFLARRVGTIQLSSLVVSAIFSFPFWSFVVVLVIAMSGLPAMRY